MKKTISSAKQKIERDIYLKKKSSLKEACQLPKEQFSNNDDEILSLKLQLKAALEKSKKIKQFNTQGNLNNSKSQ